MSRAEEIRKLRSTDALHGRVRSRWSGCLGQVAAHRDDGIEIIMDDGETLILRDQADIDDFEWLGDASRAAAAETRSPARR